MSLDYPFYEELKRRSHKAAPWWRWGDVLYYFGLIQAMLAIPVFVILSFFALPGIITWWFAPKVLGYFIACVLWFYLGMWMKGRSYIMAEQDGINVDDY